MQNITRPIILFVFVLGCLQHVNAQQTITFSLTGAPQSWTVPCGVDSVIIDMAGAEGGNYGSGNFGGQGGRVQCIYHTSPGAIFNIYVGGQGADADSAAAGGYNGGGNAGASLGGSYGSGGGGASDIRVGGNTLANRVIVAGGGGGTQTDNRSPGVGGDTIGGSSLGKTNVCFTSFATGGTQHAGGIDAVSSGACCNFTPTPNASIGVGANGAGPSATCNNGDGGAGGGGGYYGGGAGGGYGGGAGGSSYTNSNCTSIVHTQGYQYGDGYVSITYIGLQDTVKVVSNVSCFGGNNGSATVSAYNGNGSYTYLWTPTGSSSSTITGLSAGNYTVIVNSSSGCSITDTARITQPKVLSVIDSVVNIRCNGLTDGLIKLTANGGIIPYTYNWSNGKTNSIISGLSFGKYGVIITDANGCTVTDSITITQPTVLNLMLDSVIAPPCNDKLWVDVSGGTTAYTYKWSPGGATTDTLKNLCNLNYSIIVTDSHGCKDSIIVITGINELKGDDAHISVYPVPTSKWLNVDLEGNNFDASAIIISDITGGICIKEPIEYGISRMLLDVSKLKNGIYFLGVSGKNGIKSIKFEVSK